MTRPVRCDCCCQWLLTNIWLNHAPDTRNTGVGLESSCHIKLYSSRCSMSRTSSFLPYTELPVISHNTISQYLFHICVGYQQVATGCLGIIVKNCCKIIVNLSWWCSYENYVLLKLLMYLLHNVKLSWYHWQCLCCSLCTVQDAGDQVRDQWRVCCGDQGGWCGQGPGPALVLELCQLRTVSLVTVSSDYS